MKVSPALFAAAWAAFGVAGLAGCNEQLAQSARDHRAVELVEAEAAPAEAPAAVRRAGAPIPAAERGPVREIGGRPMWADSRRYSAQENAAYQFEQHGEELEARDLDDFLAKAHRFVNRPPRGAQTLTRANGDTLVYDGASGLFGVARADGAPRIVFKPDDGDAYWAAQLRENAAGGRTTARAGTGG